MILGDWSPVWVFESRAGEHTVLRGQELSQWWEPGLSVLIWETHSWPHLALVLLAVVIISIVEWQTQLISHCSTHWCLPTARHSHHHNLHCQHSDDMMWWMQIAKQCSCHKLYTTEECCWDKPVSFTWIRKCMNWWLRSCQWYLNYLTVKTLCKFSLNFYFNLIQTEFKIDPLKCHQKESFAFDITGSKHSLQRIDMSLYKMILNVPLTAEICCWQKQKILGSSSDQSCLVVNDYFTNKSSKSASPASPASPACLRVSSFNSHLNMKDWTVFAEPKFKYLISSRHRTTSAPGHISDFKNLKLKILNHIQSVMIS